MAIDRAFMHYLKPLISDKPLKIACLSYIDLLIPLNELKESFPLIDEEALTFRADSDKICAWHGITPPISIVDSLSFFTLLGHSITFLDVAAFRGVEQICDLNEDIPEALHNSFDLVIDTGTLEHCFNVGKAFINMCQLANVEGKVLTQAPLNKPNHGFWNFSPCAYENFFSQNKWKISYLLGYFRNSGKLMQFEPSFNGRFQAPPESIIISLAQKVSESSIYFPTQFKYLN
jgi:hypothetical protein